MVGFVRRPILRRVIARGMGIAAIGNELDECWTATAASPFDRPSLGRVHGEEVVTVYAEARHAIGIGPAGKRCTTGCQVAMRTDSPLIVYHVQHNRRLEDGGEVKCVMEV